MKSNNDIVQYAAAQLGHQYWYGTAGQKATKQLLTARRKQYPNYYDESKYSTAFICDNRRVFDCSGLFKAAVWSDNADSDPKYNSKQDLCANDILAKGCTKKGKISTMPDVPGVLVFYRGHMGIYIGGGKVIEARGHDYGVVITNLKERGWTDWGISDWVKYPDIFEAPAPIKNTMEVAVPMSLQRGYRGYAVIIWQALVGASIDGIFGVKTEEATRAFQKKYKLPESGKVSKEDWKKAIDNIK